MKIRTVRYGRFMLIQMTQKKLLVPILRRPCPLILVSY